MTGWSWLLYLVLVLAGGAFSAWLYLRREPEGPGRLPLAGLRTLALAILILLLLDPLLPSAGGGAGTRRPLVLLDASASMALPVGPADSTTRWAVALREASRRSREVLLFGDRVRPLPVGSLPAEPPGDERSLVLPALQAAAEAGAGRVVVITDGALEGTAGLPGWLARLGLGVDWVTVGEPLGGLSLPDVQAPAWAVSGDQVELQVTVAAAEPVPPVARLVVRQGQRTLADTTVPSPAVGGSGVITIPVRPVAPAGGGYARLDVALQPGDVLAADDRRSVSLYVSADPAGVTLVSAHPDQEPRFLLPVLARALGVPARGYLRANSSWVGMGAGASAGEPVSESEVQQSVSRAELLVVQGVGTADSPAWLEPPLRSGPPILILGGGASTALPIRTEGAVAGDWFLQQQVPASPVAELLADVAEAELPPLPALYPATPAAADWAPLLARRGRTGESRPLLLAGDAGGRRWVVALAEGYWRWAFQGGAGRALYDRLWSAIGGWLLAGGGSQGDGVRPVRRVVGRGQPSMWVTPGLRADSLRLRLTNDGRAALDTVLRNPAGDTLHAPVLPPGTYAYRAQAFAGDQRLEARGELTVETWSPELARPLTPLAGIAPADRIGRGTVGTGARRPLHTSPVPYVLLLLLLSAEWVLRRRWGLR